MSTKFFNNIESTLMDKFHGIASAMANFDIFHAVVGYFPAFNWEYLSFSPLLFTSLFTALCKAS